MASIRDLSARSQAIGRGRIDWRDQLMPASYRNALFHVETSSKENGRRIVTHQFPKKEVPYSEDMGREAKTFTVRGYCICFPYDTDVDLYKRDYRKARDALIRVLEMPGPGALQLPTYPNSPIYVVVTRYRVSEEVRFGGFCVFDMSFAEFGFAPSRTQPTDPTAMLKQRAQEMRQQVMNNLAANSPRRVTAEARRIRTPARSPQSR